MADEEMYDLVCRDRFDSIDKKLNAILEGQQKSQLDLQAQRAEIDHLKRFNKGMVGAMIFVVTTIFVQGLEWLRSKL